MWIIALLQVEVNHRKEMPIPTGWAVDKDGKVSIR